jgi:hypothetical protein
MLRRGNRLRSDAPDNPRRLGSGSGLIWDYGGWGGCKWEKSGGRVSRIAEKWDEWMKIVEFTMWWGVGNHSRFNVEEFYDRVSDVISCYGHYEIPSQVKVEGGFRGGGGDVWARCGLERRRGQAV